MKDNTNYAVIFDMDGVLVDSEPVINAAAIAGLKEFGVNAEPDDFTPFVGAGEDRYVGGVAEKYGLTYRKEMKKRVYDIYLDMVDEKLRVFKGVKKCLALLRDRGFSLALASAADRIKIDANLRVAGVSPDIFRIILSADDVKEKKPSPEMYLKTAKNLRIAPEYCIVIEDAVNGVKAAKRAGMMCIALTHTFSEQELITAGADDICSEMGEVCKTILGRQR